MFEHDMALIHHDHILCSSYCHRRSVKLQDSAPHFRSWILFFWWPNRQHLHFIFSGGFFLSLSIFFWTLLPCHYCFSCRIRQQCIPHFCTKAKEHPIRKSKPGTGRKKFLQYPKRNSGTDTGGVPNPITKQNGLWKSTKAFLQIHSGKLVFAAAESAIRLTNKAEQHRLSALLQEYLPP